MATHRRTWQKAEERIARFFGAKRNVGSGSQGRPDLLSGSDSTHERLYVEAKFRDRHAARDLVEETRKAAKKEGKLPVVALADKGRPGFLIVIHSDDFRAVAAEVLGASEGPA